MTPIEKFVLLCAVLFLMKGLCDLNRSGRCVQCGGQGDHRDDCPFKR